MARRRLMTDEQWAAFLGAPTDERMLVRHDTLSRDDLDIVAAKRTAANRLGCAVVLAYLHHPGRAPEPGEAPPSAVLAYLARQVGAKPADFTAFARRDQNRREQIAAIMARTGHRSFSRATLREMAGWLTARAQVTREPHALAVALVEERRRRRVLLPSAGVLDLVVHRARARAERLVQEIIADGLDDDGTLSVLLEPWADTGTAMLVWLRHPPLSPAARHIVGLCERLATLRDLGVPGAARERVPEAAFDRLAAEGLRTTVQHLRDLREPRRSATLAAVAVRLEAELTDAALAMFVNTLDWLRDPALRRRASAGLNKGEARNALARAVVFNRLGELRDRRFENQVFRASGLNLLVSAIILWNTRSLEVALAELAGRGVVTPPELVRHVAPLGWEHIGLTGDDVWGADQLPREGLRQLRTPPSLLAA